MVGIIDYGLGNINAFANIYYQLKVPFKIITSKSEVREATKLILPGVGSFDNAMSLFNKSGLIDEVESQVYDNKVPILGICVGMQILASNSDEGKSTGLNWIPGHVKLIDTSRVNHHIKVPHMGWNNVNIVKQNELLSNVENNSDFYFLHSYFFECEDSSNSIALTSYGNEFTCAVNKNNIYGVQFHPEKSHDQGVKILQNFSNL
jgi:glutamine amidotransferase